MQTRETLLSLQYANCSLSKSNSSAKLLVFHLLCDTLYLILNCLIFLLILISFSMFVYKLQNSEIPRP